MSSNLKVNTILPSTGTNVAIGTAGGSITMVGNVDIDINSGISTFNDIHISDKIVHDGDINTAIRFPAADTITAETGGSERLRIDSNGQFLVGHTASVAIDASHEFKVQVSGTNFPTSGISQQRFENAASGATLALAHSRNGTQGSHTILQTDDEYGKIRFYGSDGTDFDCFGAAIVAKVNGGIGINSTPGRLEFHTTVAGAADATEKLRISSSGAVSIASNNYGSGHADTKLRVGTESGSSQATAVIGSADQDVPALIITNWDGSATTNKNVIRFDNSGRGTYEIGGVGGANAFAITIDTSEKLRIDSTGNIGIAGSPKTVNTLNTIEIGNAGMFGSQIAARTVEVGTNCYYNSGWKYKHADKASLYYQYQGYHSFETATTGSADGALTFQPRLLIDNNGYVTKANQPSFLVAPATNAETANGNVIYTTVFHNTGTHYSTSTGRFTAPVTGYYTFGANFTGAAGNQNVFVRFYINGGLNQRGQHYSGGGNSLGTNVYMSCDLSGMHTLLQKDDYVQLNLAASTSQGQSSYMRFYGYLVH